MHSIDPSRIVNIFTIAIVITSVWNSTITASTIISAVTMTDITITTTSPLPYQHYQYHSHLQRQNNGTPLVFPKRKIMLCRCYYYSHVTDKEVEGYRG